MENSREPLISAIIPAYNHELYINAALESVAHQTYHNIQLIVIDDGSIDRTPDLIRQFITRHADMDIEFISKENEGVCKTLNLGLSLARGDYIAVLASDDIWLEEKTAKEVAFLNLHPEVGLVFSDAFFLVDNRIMDRKWSDYRPIVRKFFNNGMQKEPMYETLMVHPLIPALTVIFRKSATDGQGFDSSLAYEDDDFWWRIALLNPIAFLDEPLALYRQHTGNISNDTVFMLKGYLKALQKHFMRGALSSHPLKCASILFRALCSLAFNRIVRIRNRSNKNKHSEAL